jgi:hypothetical protein
VFDDIVYETEVKPDPEELAAFYQRQHHETTDIPAKLQRMMDNTFCFVTARRNGELIGIARGITDGLWGRLAECKLDPGFQGPACITRTEGRVEHDSSGIAGEMARLVIESLRAFGVERIDALAYGTEQDFCEELGFRRLPGLVVMELPSDVPLPAPPQPVGVGTQA